MKAKSLWQITINTSEEAQEAVSEMMERVIHEPASIYIDTETHAVSVTIYLTKLACQPKPLRTALEAGIDAIQNAGLNPAPGKIHIRKLAPKNWAESWKHHFKPIQIGKALLIKPSWSKLAPRHGQALVVLDPGLSFGTGRHATTSFCLQQLAARRTPEQKQSLLDIGSGSGILAICAAKLGYSPVDAFDFDPDAVRVSVENAQSNGVGNMVIPRRKDLTKLPEKSARQYDIVCANLMHDLLIAEAKKIVARLKPEGHLILAGILTTQFAEVLKTYEKLGFKLVISRIEKEWRSGELKRTMKK